MITSSSKVYLQLKYIKIVELFNRPLKVKPETICVPPISAQWLKKLILQGVVAVDLKLFLFSFLTAFFQLVFQIFMNLFILSLS